MVSQRWQTTSNRINIFTLRSNPPPQGNIVISSSLDELIKRWDLETGELLILRSPRPYEGMNITQMSTLKALGAVET